MSISKNTDLFTKPRVHKLHNKMVLQNGKIAISLKLLVLFYMEHMCLTTIGLMLLLQQYISSIGCHRRFLNLKLRCRPCPHLYRCLQYKCCHLVSLGVLHLFTYIKTSVPSLIRVPFAACFWDMVHTRKGIAAMTLLLDACM